MPCDEHVLCYVCGKAVCAICGCCANSNCEQASCPERPRDNTDFDEIEPRTTHS